jgi:hypothetical protein
VAKLERYRFGRLTINGREHTRDVIVLPRRVVENWWRRDGHSLCIEDLEEVLGELPERLIIGSGAYGRLKPDAGALEALKKRGISVEIHDTAEAVLRYDELDERRTAAALHLTC